jgi:hypothetical protein
MFLYANKLELYNSQEACDACLPALHTMNTHMVYQTSIAFPPPNHRPSTFVSLLNNMNDRIGRL